MAITKVGAMTDPPVAGDYAILQAKLDAYAKQVGNQGMILTEWTNTTTVPKIAMGSYITHGGTLFIVDTEDFAVTEPAGDGTYYLKVSVSGDTLGLSWVASTAGYAWNSIYNGLYHADESQILPYQLVKAGASVEKWKITNLMQGGGFSRVRYDGVLRCESLAVTSINTGSGAMTFDQGVKTTDSPTFAKLTLTTSTYGSQSIASNATWVVPVGIYMLPYTVGVFIEIWSGSAWSGVTSAILLGVLISDGSNIRLKNAIDGTATIQYRKFS